MAALHDSEPRLTTVAGVRRHCCVVGTSTCGMRKSKLVISPSLAGILKDDAEGATGCVSRACSSPSKSCGTWGLLRSTYGGLGDLCVGRGEFLEGLAQFVVCIRDVLRCDLLRLACGGDVDFQVAPIGNSIGDRFFRDGNGEWSHEYNLIRLRITLEISVFDGFLMKAKYYWKLPTDQEDFYIESVVRLGNPRTSLAYESYCCLIMISNR